MGVITWKDEYATGVAKIDEEHKRLVEMINDAHAGADNLPDGKAAKVVISEMREYASSHFKTEEELMERYGYPDKEEHLRAHEAFLKKVESSESEFASDSFVPAAVKVVSYLADWLVNHILKTDIKFGRFLKEQGVD